MKNITIINKENIESHILSLWSTDEFKRLHQNHIFFQQLLSELKKRELFFFNTTHPQQKNHLTSIFNFIAYREYENKYIQDLYYFHELVHCAHYNKFVNPYLPYTEWQKKISYNEMFASLFSEVFIYFFEPNLLDKSFPNLWIHQFLDFNQNFEEFTQLPFNTEIEKQHIHYLCQEDNFFSLLDNFHKNATLFDIFMRRIHLRNLSTDSPEFSYLSESEKTIVLYNKSHKRWLNNWFHQYMFLENHLYDFSKGTTTSEYFLNIVLSSKNRDIYERPFIA